MCWDLSLIRLSLSLRKALVLNSEVVPLVGKDEKSTRHSVHGSIRKTSFLSLKKARFLFWLGRIQDNLARFPREKRCESLLVVAQCVLVRNHRREVDFLLHNQSLGLLPRVPDFPTVNGSHSQCAKEKALNVVLNVDRLFGR